MSKIYVFNFQQVIKNLFLVENVEIFTQWVLDITDTDEPVVESVQKVIIFFLYIFTYHLFS